MTDNQAKQTGIAMAKHIESKETVLESRRRAADRHLCITKHISEDTLNCECPVCGKRDCRVYLSGARAFLKCFRPDCAQGCADVAAEITAEPEYGTADFNPSARADDVTRRQMKELEEMTRNRVLPAILRNHGVPVHHFIDISPFKIPPFGPQQWQAMIKGLFPDVDAMGNEVLIWAGERHESGDPIYASRWRTREQWLQSDGYPGDQLSLCLWRPSIYSRTRQNVLMCEYLLFESDDLPILAQANVIEYLRGILKLRAIVHSGGKSLHAVFDKPEPKRPRLVEVPTLINDVWNSEKKEWGPSPQVAQRFEASRQRNAEAEAEVLREHEKLLAVLRGLGCDPQVLKNPAMTCRLPGVDRVNDDNEVIGQQKLLYLDPRYA